MLMCGKEDLCVYGIEPLVIPIIESNNSETPYYFVVYFCGCSGFMQILKIQNCIFTQSLSFNSTPSILES